jgi:hypothetical protein
VSLLLSEDRIEKIAAIKFLKAVREPLSQGIVNFLLSVLQGQDAALRLIAMELLEKEQLPGEALEMFFQWLQGDNGQLKETAADLLCHSQHYLPSSILEDMMPLLNDSESDLGPVVSEVIGPSGQVAGKCDCASSSAPFRSEIHGKAYYASSFSATATTTTKAPRRHSAGLGSIT